MGNRSARTQPDSNTNLSDSYCSEVVLETQSRKRTYCLDLCFASNPYEAEEEPIEWCLQTKGNLIRKYRKFPWSRRLRKFLSPENDFSSSQAGLISDITNISQQYINLSQGKGGLNIQYSQYSYSGQLQTIRPMAKSQILTQFKQSKDEKGAVKPNQFAISMEITEPHRANSLLEPMIQEQHKTQDRTETDTMDDISLRGFYKKTMQIIENHLKEPTNPLKWFLSIYLKNFKEVKSGLVEKKDNLRLSDQLLTSRVSVATDTPKKVREVRSHSIVDDIKSFIEFYTISLYSFYNLDRILTMEQLVLFNKQNLSSFVVTLLFRNDQLFQHIFEGLRDTNIEETDKFYVSLLAFQDKRPSFFGVPMHLELMVDTIPELEVNKHEIQETLDEDSSYLHNETLRSVTLSKYTKKFNEEEKTYDIRDEQPYNLAIRQLRQLSKARSPIHQLKLISKTTELIQASINQFYIKNDLKLINNFGADELVPILCYVIVRSQVKDLGTYLKLIENFTPRQTLNSSEGYKLVTLQNCFFIISNWNQGSQQNLELILSNRILSKSFQESVQFGSFPALRNTRA